MMFATLLVSALLAQATSAAAPQAAGPQAPPPSADWLVIVAAPVYQPDGAVAAETVTLPASGAGLVHLFARRSICSPAVAGASEPTDAGFGWRIASQVVSKSDKDLVVSIDWRRLWDAGRKTSSGPGGTVQLTLHPGDRIPLDHIVNAAPRADCRAVGLGLEVRLGRSPSMAPAPPPSANLLPLGATAGGEKPFDAELWLMHTLPSGAEQVTHQVVRIKPAGGKFGFAATKVATPRGDVQVELTGSIDRFRVPTGGEFFLLSMTRLVTGDALPPDGVSGTTSTIVAMPSAADVLSFEIPGRQRGAGGARGGAGAAEGRVIAGAGGTGGAVMTRTPPASGATARTVDPAQAGAARAGGGGGRGGAIGPMTGSRPGADNAQVAALLEGHLFSIRLKVTQVN